MALAASQPPEIAGYPTPLGSSRRLAGDGRNIVALQRESTCWCGPTTWRGRRAMRISISNWSTTEADVDRSVAAVLAVAQASAHQPKRRPQAG